MEEGSPRRNLSYFEWTTDTREARGADATISSMGWLETFLVGLAVVFVGWVGRKSYPAVSAWWRGRPERKRARRRAKERQKREERLSDLRKRVRGRAEFVGVDLPWNRDREWRGPGDCILYLSGERSYYIDAYEHGIGQYERAMRDGTVPPQRTFPTRAPNPVMRWSEAELQAWLDEHPDA